MNLAYTARYSLVPINSFTVNHNTILHSYNDIGLYETSPIQPDISRTD